jgi:hypothetical protein
MKQPEKLPEIGTRLRTRDKLESTKGFMIAQRHLDVRRPSSDCVYIGWVPGHGGDVWWCEHPGAVVAAYSWTELEFA